MGSSAERLREAPATPGGHREAVPYGGSSFSLRPRTKEKVLQQLIGVRTPARQYLGTRNPEVGILCCGCRCRAGLSWGARWLLDGVGTSGENPSKSCRSWRGFLNSLQAFSHLQTPNPLHPMALNPAFWQLTLAFWQLSQSKFECGSLRRHLN